MSESWTTEEAIRLCKMIESICPTFGCHVALTGGLLYKEGARKDADIVFYRIRQIAEIDVVGLFDALAALGIERLKQTPKKFDVLADIFKRALGEVAPSDDDWSERWCIKARFEGRGIDCFFPENTLGEYL